MSFSPTPPSSVSRRAVVRHLSFALGGAGLAAALSGGRATPWAQSATPETDSDAYPHVDIMGKDVSFELPAEIAER